MSTLSSHTAPASATPQAPTAESGAGTRILVFGAGSGAVDLPVVARARGWEIAAYVDNDTRKQGREFQNRPVIGPQDMDGMAHDLIVVASAWAQEIRAQLLDMGIDAARILQYPDLEYDWGKPVIPCHYRTLLVKHDGLLLPCCRVGTRGVGQDLSPVVIGHVDDDLAEILPRFDTVCECGPARFRKARSEEKPHFTRIFFELSLKCQGKCAMCIAHAEEFSGKAGKDYHYDRYDSLEKILAFANPTECVFLGGEVLVQKRSVEWLGRMRDKYPHHRFALITNGSVPVSMADEVERIFDRISVSFVGFAPQTYRTIMGLDRERTLAFVDRMHQGGKSEVFLKYLMTPLGAHELPDFLEWAIGLGTKQIRVIATHDFATYVRRDTFDSFWDKIFERTREATEKAIDAGRAAMQANGTELWISPEVNNILGMDRPEFHKPLDIEDDDE